MDILKRIPYWGTVALLVYMPFHIFLAQWLSLTTGGIEVWKVAKDVVLAGLVLFTICLVVVQKTKNKAFYWLVGLTAVYFCFHLIVYGLNQDIYSKSAVLGTVYNLRLPAFVVLGCGAMLLWPSKFAFSSLLKVVLIVSTVVACLGILQFFLPKDLLEHFGYGLDRGTRPAFFIDDKVGLPRVMSTLREPNALGAYLILPFTALTLLFFAAKQTLRRWLILGFWLIHGVAILLTFSRSAWLGAALSVALAIWWQHRSPIVRVLKKYWPVLVVGVMAVVLVGFLAKDNQFVRNYVTHSTPEEVQDLDSNDYHWLFIRKGFEGIVQQPAGHGPGTAGIVSIQTPGGANLTENYYLQIGYEVGVFGLAVFLLISIWIYLRLMRRGDLVGVVLVSSFWGYVVTNMLLHTWSNEAVAAQWWLLAGMALAGVSASLSVASQDELKHREDS